MTPSFINIITIFLVQIKQYFYFNYIYLMSSRNLQGLECNLASEEFTDNSRNVQNATNKSKPKSREASIGINSPPPEKEQLALPRQTSKSDENLTQDSPLNKGKNKTNEGELQSKYLLHIIASDNSMATEFQLNQIKSRKVVDLENDRALLESPLMPDSGANISRLQGPLDAKGFQNTHEEILEDSANTSKNMIDTPFKSTINQEENIRIQRITENSVRQSKRASQNLLGGYDQQLKEIERSQERTFIESVFQKKAPSNQFNLDMSKVAEGKAQNFITKLSPSPRTALKEVEPAVKVPDLSFVATNSSRQSPRPFKSPRSTINATSRAPYFGHLLTTNQIQVQKINIDEIEKQAKRKKQQSPLKEQAFQMKNKSIAKRDFYVLDSLIKSTINQNLNKGMKTQKSTFEHAHTETFGNPESESMSREYELIQSQGKDGKVFIPKVKVSELDETKNSLSNYVKKMSMTMSPEKTELTIDQQPTLTGTNTKIKEGFPNETVGDTNFLGVQTSAQRDKDLDIQTEQTKLAIEESKMAMRQTIQKRHTSLMIDDIILDQYEGNIVTVPDDTDSPNTIKKAERMGVFTLNTTNRNNDGLALFGKRASNLESVGGDSNLRSPMFMKNGDSVEDNESNLAKTPHQQSPQRLGTTQPQASRPMRGGLGKSRHQVTPQLSQKIIQGSTPNTGTLKEIDGKHQFNFPTREMAQVMPDSSYPQMSVEEGIDSKARIRNLQNENIIPFLNFDIDPQEQELHHSPRFAVPGVVNIELYPQGPQSKKSKDDDSKGRQPKARQKLKPINPRPDTQDSITSTFSPQASRYNNIFSPKGSIRQTQNDFDTYSMVKRCNFSQRQQKRQIFSQAQKNRHPKIISDKVPSLSLASKDLKEQTLKQARRKVSLLQNRTDVVEIFSKNSAKRNMETSINQYSVSSPVEETSRSNARYKSQPRGKRSLNLSQYEQSLPSYRDKVTKNVQQSKHLKVANLDSIKTFLDVMQVQKVRTTRNTSIMPQNQSRTWNQSINVPTQHSIDYQQDSILSNLKASPRNNDQQQASLFDSTARKPSIIASKRMTTTAQTPRKIRLIDKPGVPFLNPQKHHTFSIIESLQEKDSIHTVQSTVHSVKSTSRSNNTCLKIIEFNQRNMAKLAMEYQREINSQQKSRADYSVKTTENVKNGAPLFRINKMKVRETTKKGKLQQDQAIESFENTKLFQLQQLHQQIQIQQKSLEELQYLESLLDIVKNQKINEMNQQLDQRLGWAQEKLIGSQNKLDQGQIQQVEQILKEQLKSPSSPVRVFDLTLESRENSMYIREDVKRGDVSRETIKLNNTPKQTHNNTPANLFEANKLEEIFQQNIMSNPQSDQDPNDSIQPQKTISLTQLKLNSQNRSQEDKLTEQDIENINSAIQIEFQKFNEYAVQAQKLGVNLERLKCKNNEIFSQGKTQDKTTPGKGLDSPIMIPYMKVRSQVNSPANHHKKNSGMFSPSAEMSPGQGCDSTSNSVMNSPGILLSPMSQKSNLNQKPKLKIENQQDESKLFKIESNLDTLKLQDARDVERAVVGPSPDTPSPSKGQAKNQSMISVLNIRQESQSNEIINTEPTRTINVTEENEMVANYDSKSDQGDDLILLSDKKPDGLILSTEKVNEEEQHFKKMMSPESVAKFNFFRKFSHGQPQDFKKNPNYVQRLTSLTQNKNIFDTLRNKPSPRQQTWQNYKQGSLQIGVMGSKFQNLPQKKPLKPIKSRLNRDLYAISTQPYRPLPLQANLDELNELSLGLEVNKIKLGSWNNNDSKASITHQLNYKTNYGKAIDQPICPIIDLNAVNSSKQHSRITTQRISQPGNSRADSKNTQGLETQVVDKLEESPTQSALMSPNRSIQEQQSAGVINEKIIENHSPQTPLQGNGENMRAKIFTIDQLELQQE